MTDDVAGAVAARLEQLAARAGTGDDTAARALAVDRHRRRRAGRWVAGALAVVLLGTGASLARSAVAEAPTDRATVIATATATWAPFVTPPPTLYDVPTRGSLAGDEEFLAAMAETSWTDPTGPDGPVPDWGMPAPVPGTQRVVYAADVPGDQRWAVVIAQSGAEWVYAWFTGPRGGEPAEMTPLISSMPVSGRDRLALLDAPGETGTLVVLAEPGSTAEYSPSLDRAPSGQLVRDHDRLPTVDGVPLDVVPAPLTWTAGLVRVTTPDDGQLPLFPTLARQPTAWPEYPSGEVDPALAAPCLEAIGVTVEFYDDGYGLSSGTATGEMSSAEEFAHEEAIAACFRAAER
ncbi:hypothetical protein [uncultured Modestobacter sp.]|uniref:hypothetical protein n=1 Tax=uncultured Modestobacter sp. TaxID=380048 RepID=UPI0026023C66|nr:hypothetical protein [uncultured Modestobacter sp.]